MKAEHSIGGPDLVAKCEIQGVSDAIMHVEVFRFDAWDRPAAHVRFFMQHGIFSTNTDGALPHPGDIGEQDHAVVVISLRDRGNSELLMLARALRWAADQLDLDDTVTLHEIAVRKP